MNKKSKQQGKSSWRETIHTIIFEADTPGGKLFDVVLIIFILLSVVVVMLDSITKFQLAHKSALYYLEWFFTIVFTIEYLFRIISVRHPSTYIYSFYGVIDLLAIIPTYASLIFPGTHYFLVVRLLRIMRIFRVMKFVQYVSEAKLLMNAIKASRRKIFVFLLAVITILIILGSIMYVIEGPENGFTSIPTAVYWAIITFTTVGYGDITPQTSIGQAISAIVMILGYSIIVVPTGLVTVELSRAEKPISTQVCPECGAEGHDADAVYCKYCGSKL
ncbi:ion transporter [candidate division KSB1 bacterium]|nr:ion transporter [candidate division KSB1 bacterium]